MKSLKGEKRLRHIYMLIEQLADAGAPISLRILVELEGMQSRSWMRTQVQELEQRGWIKRAGKQKSGIAPTGKVSVMQVAGAPVIVEIVEN
jgi:SOS-response transcriptional repressor LexA